MKFNELLKEYIDTQGITIYQISKQTQINRTFIQNVLAGRKKFPQKRLGDLLDSAFFTNKQIKALCNMYFIEKYGKRVPEIFDFYNYCLSKKFEADMCQKYETDKIELDGDVKFLDCEQKILSAINMAVSEANGDIFISNFNFNKKEINRIIYTACKNKKFKEFYHYTKYTEDEIQNANIIFNSIYYAKHGYLTYIDNYNNFNLMFPEFVMCNDIIVMFNSEATSGSILRNKELTDHIIKQNEKILHNAKNDVVVYHNPFEYMQYLDIKSSKRSNPEIKVLDNHVCGMGITKEIIDDIATDEIKSSTQVYQQLVSHFDLLLNKSTSNIKKWCLSYNAVIDFCKTGRLWDFPSGLANRLKPKHRADILQFVLNHECQLRLTNPEYEKFDELAVNIELCQHQLIISYVDENCDADLDLGIQVIFETENTNITNSFDNYLEYLTISEKTYSSDYSKSFIQSRIDILNAE